MGRTARERGRPPGLRPVERVAVNEKHIGRRFIAFFVCLAVAVTAIGYGVYSWMNTDPGWVTVEVSGDQKSAGGEFAFDYLLGASGMNTTQELRAVRSAYSSIAVRAYRVFTVSELFEDGEDVGVLHNMAYINAHPNEDIVVDGFLYGALRQTEESGSRAVYLGPLYSVYQDLFFCGDDSETRELDPFQDQEAAAFCRELAAFANDPAHVRLEFLDNSTLRLHVSEEYAGYVQDAGRACYLDFGWLRTAFVADYLAEQLQEQGLAYGLLSSYDGCTRNLGGLTGQQVFSLYDWAGERGIAAAQAAFETPVNAVSLRTFPLNSLDEERCYMFEDGQRRHGYIDAADGLCRAAVDSLALYSADAGCGELALRAGEFLIAEELDRTGLAALDAEGIGAIAAENRVVLYTQEGLPLSDLYDLNDIRYQIEYIGD